MVEVSRSEPLRSMISWRNFQLNTDRIDRRSQRLGERLAKRYILKRSISGWYSTWRSVTYRPRAITSNNTDRTKVLQMTILLMMWSMRSVFIMRAYRSRATAVMCHAATSLIVYRRPPLLSCRKALERRGFVSTDHTFE
jgi:hypothetical protein